MKKIFVLLTALAFVFAGCERNFEEINSNPNDPTEVPATNVLLTAISSGVYELQDDLSHTYAALFVQHFAKIQYIDEDKYAYRPAALDIMWTNLYARALFDLQDIINRATDDTPNMKAAAMVMKAYYMSVITDLWGSVPYSEALQGSESLTPAYDSQDGIYAGLIQDLADAAAMFDPAADDLGLGDIIYGGDVMMWQKLANSLRVRLIMRTADRDGSAYTTALSIINSEPVFTSNADNAMVAFVGDNSYSHPLYANKYFDGRDDHAISQSVTDVMNAGGFSSAMDPRLPVYAEQNNAGLYVGQPNGAVEPADFSGISRIGAAFRDDATAPGVIMTYAELKFFEAEASNSKAAYLEAISASNAMHGVSDDATYMADADAAWDANMMDALGTQKWLALFGNAPEAFSEWRRLDFPVLAEPSNSVYPGQGIPTRFPYASTEQLTNGTNLSAAISDQGVDASGLFAKVWWDAN